MSNNIALSSLSKIHAALVRVHNCFDHSDELEGWQASFLQSLDRQLHRGRPLTYGQSVVLDRVWQRLVGNRRDDDDRFY
jgi:hypothetical protein